MRTQTFPTSTRRPFAVWLSLAMAVLLGGCLNPPAGGDTPAQTPGAQAQASTSSAARAFSGDALALARAAERGDAAEIRRLIEQRKVDPDRHFARESGLPLVAWPVSTGSPEGLRALLEHGADPNARRPERETDRFHDGSTRERHRHDNALVLAARADDPTYLRLLLEHGGDPNTRSMAGEPLTLVAFLAGNRWDNIKLLIERGADIDADTWSGPPIQWYSGRGAFEQVYWLLEHGADVRVRTEGHRPAPRDADGRYLPQPHMPKDGHAWLLYDEDGQPVTTVRDTVIDDIYWHPGNPDAPQWQRKCQQWLQARGIARPPMPDHLREMRRTFGFPHEESEIARP